MRVVRRGFWILLIIFLLFFGLNFAWSHAAVVWMVTKVECPAKSVARARRDVASLFGRTKASPLWVCTRKPLLGLDVSHGSTRSALFLPSIIVVGKKGPRRNVMAHEFSHAELAARTKARYFLVPTWFDEGLAMQVDHRRAYSRKALSRYLRRNRGKKPSLEDLASPWFFYKRGKAWLHYSFASCVVKGWLKSQGSNQPLDLINKFGWQTPFPIDQFRKYERRCLQG